MNRLEGKVAVVTGSTQGLGAATAHMFAEAGALGIVICGRQEEKGHKVAADILAATECPVRFVPADLGLVEDCRRVIKYADETFGRVDILVNSAGLTDRGDILNTEEALFDRLMAVNVRAPFFLMQEAIKVMIREEITGSIVNIGSRSATTGQPFLTAYSTTKGALATLTRNTAHALVRNRIRVNQLNIGWMATDGEDRTQREFHAAPDDWLEKAAAQMPFGRLLDPVEVARAITFLSSDDSGMMTGSVVEFDQTVCDGSPAIVEPVKLS